MGMGEPSTPRDFSLVDLQSMPDASKRRSDAWEDEQAPKRTFAIDVPYVTEGPPQPVLVGKTPRGKPIYLTQDVPNVTTWGAASFSLVSLWPSVVSRACPMPSCLRIAPTLKSVAM